MARCSSYLTGIKSSGHRALFTAAPMAPARPMFHRFVQSAERVMTKLEQQQPRRAGALQEPLRQLHRRQMGRARQRQLLRKHHADHRPAVLRDRALGRRRRRSRARCRARGEGCLGPHLAPPSARTSSTGSPTAWRRISICSRIAETWDNGKPIRETTRRRHAARDRSFPLLRRLHPRAGRLALRDRPRHGRLSLPRAARRRRPDHSVEFPAADGDVEARAGARRRQLRRAEAGRADAGLASWSGPS